ncbi:hypothetical protein ABZ557_23875 [Streptomyces sp. NPDC019645]|uniref:hypothetical protein n=1 Tax=Streptomyces sp. NPDC019645 TaxID=3154786 RepID=UPI0033D1FC83
MLSLVARRTWNAAPLRTHPLGRAHRPLRHRRRGVHRPRLGGAAAAPGDASFWTAVAWLVALSAVGGDGLYWLILRRSGVTRVNALMFLMAPVTAVWGALLFGEPFGAAVGMAASLAAVTVVHRDGDRGGTGPRPHRIGAGSRSSP